MKLTPSEGKWFTYPDDDEVQIRIKRIPFDAFQGDLSFYDRAIVDWKGIKDAEGNDVPCTRETKLYVLFETEEGQDMSWWVLRKTQSWDEFIDMERIKKKLSKQSNGTSTSQKQTAADATNV